MPEIDADTVAGSGSHKRITLVIALVFIHCAAVNLIKSLRL